MPEVFHIYVDESSQNAHHYMVVGASFTRKDAAAQISEALTALLHERLQRPDKEYHWSEVTKFSLPLYSDAVATFLGFIKAKTGGALRYRALVVDNHKVDHYLASGGDRDETLAKFIFTLLFGFARDFGANVHYHVWIDSRGTIGKSDDATRCSLNNKVKAELGWGTEPFKLVKFVDSRASRLIQATDVVTGAIAYAVNGRHKVQGAAPHKIQLMEHVATCAKVPSLERPHEKFPRKFILWHFDFDRSRLQRK